MSSQASATFLPTAASCCLPLPGHTPGSLGALARLDRSGTFLLAGDTVSLRETLDTGIIPRNTWNGEALAKSLAEVRHIEIVGRDHPVQPRRAPMGWRAQGSRRL